MQDHGTGGLWTLFGLNNSESILYQKALQNLPKYLYVAKNTNPWPRYNRVSEYTNSEGSMHAHERALFEKDSE